MKRPSAFRLLGASQGFSLVELAVAMAIMGFGLISILGLVPMGLTNFRQVMNNSAESQIVQTISSDQQLTSFSKLQDTTCYFDADGNTVATASQAIYTATVTISSITGSSYPVSMANSADKVTIAIANKTQPSQAHVYSVIVANQNN